MKVIEMYEMNNQEFTLFLDFKDQKWFFPNLTIEVDYRDHKSFMNLDGRYFEEIDREYKIKLYRSDFNQYNSVDQDCEPLENKMILNEQEIVNIMDYLKEYIEENIENFISEDEYDDHDEDFDRDYFDY
jgi:hypothetical protein